MFKNLLVSGFTTLAIMGFTAAIPQASLAQDDVEFFCDTREEVPVMKLRVPGGEVSFIRWKDEYFERFGLTQVERCQEIAKRFQRFQQDGSLDYMGHGFINNQPTVCIIDNVSLSKCKHLLITLRPEYGDHFKRQQLVTDLWNIGRYGNSFGPLSLRSASFDQDSSSINVEQWIFDIRAWLQYQNPDADEQ